MFGGTEKDLPVYEYDLLRFGDYLDSPHQLTS